MSSSWSSSGRPVDEGDREAVAGDDVPGSGVAVTDDGVGGLAVEGPGVPDRVGRGLEAGGRVVEIAQETADVPDPFVAPGARVHDVAGNVGQDLAAVTVVVTGYPARRPRGADANNCE
jgi:hypothetical protein